TKEGKAGGMSLKDIKSALGLSVYLQGGYTYNFEDPGSGENGLRVFDHKANSFTLDLAQIQFVKDPVVGGVGFKLKVSAGETAKWIHSNGLGEVGKYPFDLTEAYVSYIAPLGKGLRFDFGKFVTSHGAEVIEARDNPNYSRSFLFNYAIPFTHTGLKIGYAFSDALNATVHLVNGWDNSADNNQGKTVGLTVGYSPLEQFSTTVNLMYGPEKDDNNHDNRFLLDWVGTVKPVKNLSFILNVDYGTDQHSAPDGGEAKWYGWSVIGKYDFNDWFSVALRGEYFNDHDGFRTGTPQRLKEVTLTPQFVVAKNLLVRPEYRHDWSDAESFAGSHGGSKKSQDTLALGVMYTW
ncbi:MAG: porin, partial [Nitrospirae bacterium]|nr:porin [Nitrospirota bacterium]